MGEYGSITWKVDKEEWVVAGNYRHHKAETDQGVGTIGRIPQSEAPVIPPHHS